jgi:hypothetical protein
MRFFIRDCNGQIVGNPKGYETHRGAQAQTANWRSPAARAIADAFQAREAAQIAARVPVNCRASSIFTINSKGA